MSEQSYASHADVQNLREDLQRHADQDRQDFRDVADRIDGAIERIQKIQRDIAQWSGALCLAKWALGLGIPAIFAAAVTHVVRHW